LNAFPVITADDLSDQLRAVKYYKDIKVRLAQIKEWSFVGKV
jgi:hypothetical protein